MEEKIDQLIVMVGKVLEDITIIKEDVVDIKQTLGEIIGTPLPSDR